MTSNDLIIIEAINGLEGKIINLQSEMNQKFEIVNKRIDNLQVEVKDTRKDLMTEIRVNQAETRAVHDKVNMGFTLTTVFLGVIGGLALLQPAIKALGQYFENRRKNYTTEEQVQNIVETAINKASAGISR